MARQAGRKSASPTPEDSSSSSPLPHSPHGNMSSVNGASASSPSNRDVNHDMSTKQATKQAKKSTAEVQLRGIINPLMYNWKKKNPHHKLLPPSPALAPSSEDDDFEPSHAAPDRRLTKRPASREPSSEDKDDEVVSSPAAPGAGGLNPRPTNGSTSRTTARLNTAAQAPRDNPRRDRAGNPRPANARFLPRNIHTGKLVAPASGKKDTTQVEEIRAWAAEKNYVKFDLIPNADEFVFDDIDPNFITQPQGTKNRGRKLLVGTHEDTEVWAVMPVHPKRLYVSRLLARNVTNDEYTGIGKWEELRAAVPQLDYPFRAFQRFSEIDPGMAWTQLLTIISYVFLHCGEADIAFTDSSKWPGVLSTALTRIKEVYAPNDDRPNADTVDRDITIEVANNDSDIPQLQAIDTWLRQKGLLSKMREIVSMPEIFTFKDYYRGTLQAKGILKAHNRALFMGQDDFMETWAVLTQNPSKAQLGWIINVDKATGEQTPAKYWPDLPTLTFPFEAFKDKGDQLDWRKMMYVIGYVFLVCGEAEIAVNMGEAFFRHFTSITKCVEKYYGTVTPVEDWDAVVKPDISDDGDESDHDSILSPGFLGNAIASTPRHPSKVQKGMPVHAAHSSKSGTNDTGSRPDGALKNSNGVAKNRKDTAREPLQRIPDRSNTLNAQKTSNFAKTPRTPTFPKRPTFAGSSSFRKPFQPLKGTPIAGNSEQSPHTPSDGTYTSMEDLRVDLFLEETQRRKRNADDDDDDDDDVEQENRVAKYLRLENAKVEGQALRVTRERRAEHLRKEAEKVAREKVQLQERELDITAELGQLMSVMSDAEVQELDKQRADHGMEE